MAPHIGRSPGAVCRMATGRGDTYTRLLRGHDIRSRLAARILHWFSDNWPADLAWPRDIPRPNPSASIHPTIINREGAGAIAPQSPPTASSALGAGNGAGALVHAGGEPEAAS